MPAILQASKASILASSLIIFQLYSHSFHKLKKKSLHMGGKCSRMVGEFLGGIFRQPILVHYSSCQLHKIYIWEASFTYDETEEPAMNFRSMC